MLLHKSPADGLSEAINAYGGIATAVVMRILKNPQEAEECVADTFVALWKNIHELSKIDSLKAYLLCIARNKAIDRYRKLKKLDVISIDGLDDFVIIADDDVELLVINNEFMDELQASIMKMPEPNREIFIRKYFLFEQIKEIAERLDLTEVQVKDRLYRIRKQLRQKYEKRRNNNAEIIYTASG
jgi:RNA polymerase sigma-70 factor (ECF subfamily)